MSGLGFSARTVFWILASAACYYLATRTAWVLCFPDSKVSLFFPPHAILVSILLLVPTRHWWAYTLAAVGSHFFATQQADWPPLYALQCEAFDAVKAVLTAAGIRLFIKSPFHLISLARSPRLRSDRGDHRSVRDGLLGRRLHRRQSLWNALLGRMAQPRHLECGDNDRAGAGHPDWRPPATHGKASRPQPVRILEAGFLAAGILAVGWLAFDRMPAGPDTSPALLYAPIPLLIWAALRFGLGGISASVLVITMLAIWGTMQGRGPFLTQSPAENALALQLFILVAATPLMLLAVAIDDERRSKEALRVSEERMSLAAESAQLALWDWDVANDRIWIQDQGTLRLRPGRTHRSLHAGRTRPSRRSRGARDRDPARAGEWRYL